MKHLPKNAAKLYLELLYLEFFTMSELDLIIEINGFSVDSLNYALFVRYGFRDLEEYFKVKGE